MQKVEIQSQYRQEYGKGVARKLRVRGQIPAVLYSKGTSVALQLNLKEIDRALRSGSGDNTLMTFQVDQGKGVQSHLAILREIQRDPITGTILHVDLFEVSMNEPLILSVPVEIVGTVMGVKDGGILQHTMRELSIRALPALIPDRISVDASTLKIGETIHVRDLSLAEGIEILADPNRVVVSVVPPISEAKMEAILAPGVKETKAPEVIGEKEKAEKAEAAGKGKPAEKAEKAKPEGKK